ncbi:MAG TPA: hypothetical protein VH855_12955 [Acetobacteraceae bacterium]|jgi:hypothetical protein
MPFDAPFTLGPFSVDGEGRLTPANPAMAPRFHFRCHNRLIQVRFDRADRGTGRLVLQVALARVPSTARSPDQALRPRSFALLHWLERILPPGWRVALLADHRFWLDTETPIGLPITAAGLVTELTRFALELGPYLELMDEVGLTISDYGHR